MVIAAPAELSTDVSFKKLDTPLASLGPLPDCDEELERVNPLKNSTGQFFCQKKPSNTTDTDKAAARDLDRRWNGPYCRTSPAFLGLNAATILCGQVANELQVPAASSTACICNVQYYSTAAWAVCNCDKCSAIGASGLRGLCRNVVNTCLSRTGEGGYYSNYAPTGYASLYGQGGNDPVPAYVQCG
jgi:hypothetical protein